VTKYTANSKIDNGIDVLTKRSVRLPSSMVSAAEDTTISTRTPLRYTVDDHLKNRSARFPSIDERVRLYMTHWYAPPCSARQRILYAFRNADDTNDPGGSHYFSDHRDKTSTAKRVPRNVRVLTLPTRRSFLSITFQQRQRKQDSELRARHS
jgi:hypothetical protein